MTTHESTGAPVAFEQPHGIGPAVQDALTEAGRHLRVIPRNIELLIFAAVQPIMFVLLFAYVFGGSIEVPGFTNYYQYLMPGIFAQTVVFGSAFTSIGIAEDMTKGFIDRLRSLPITQASVLVGRTLSDLARNVFTFVIMLAVAFIIGFRFEGSFLAAIAATLILLSFSYALSWVQALIGLSVKSVEAANSGGFIWMFPITFVSSAFVSTDTLPGPLEAFADANPFTLVTNAARALYNGNEVGNSAWYAIAYSIGITAVFAVLSVRKFDSASS